MKAQDQKGEFARIYITVSSQKFEAILYDNPTSRSLLDQVPFTVDTEDYAGMEKIFYPPESLSKEKAPNGAEPKKGDIMYYAPWGDVAIFYKGFRFSGGLIPLGKIENIEGFKEAIGSGKPITISKN